jgi:hypothetical protein
VTARQRQTGLDTKIRQVETKKAGERPARRKKMTEKTGENKLTEAAMFGATDQLPGILPHTVECQCLSLASASGRLIDTVNAEFTPEEIDGIRDDWENMLRACRQLDGALAEVIAARTATPAKARPTSTASSR